MIANRKDGALAVVEPLECPVNVSLNLVPPAECEVAAIHKTAEQAMRLAPVQRDVDYDKPPASEIAKCLSDAMG